MGTGGETRARGPVIETRGLTKTFGSVAALQDLSLRVPAGSVFGYLGPNGAGKTTTIRILVGLLRPTRGEALLLGQSVATSSDVVDRIGALVERPAFYPYLSARDNLHLFAAARGMSGASAAELADAALRRTDLLDVASRNVGGFSTGMRQRLGIALALLGDPPLVILDEPTTGLDPQGMIEVRQLIADLARAGSTVFLSTHLLAEAEQLCTEVAVIDRGRLVTAGPTADLFATRQHLWLRFSLPGERDAALGALTAGGSPAQPDGETTATVPGETDGSRIIRVLAEAGIYPAEVAVRRPSLEQLYMELTGEHAAEPAA